MGTSFLNYLNETRLAHIYGDLITTDAPIAEVMENNGFTNQKLFNRAFKELYGCPPSLVRKAGSEKQYNISTVLLPPEPEDEGR